MNTADINVWACWYDDWHQRIEGIEARTAREARIIASSRTGWPAYDIIARYRKTISRGMASANTRVGPQDRRPAPTPAAL